MRLLIESNPIDALVGDSTCTRWHFTHASYSTDALCYSVHAIIHTVSSAEDL